jgi:integrase
MFLTKLLPILYIAVFTGMREGEILGLCWDKIDIDNKKIKVHRSVYEGEMREFTKTSTSHRTVDMTNSLAELFKELKRKRQLLSKLVFPNDVGKPKLASNMLRRRFHPCLKQAFGEEKIKFHELRHSYVSFLLAQGVPMKYIQHQVGHSTINITMNTYGHLLEDVHENAVQVLDNISDKMKSEKQSKVNLPQFN